MRLNSYLKTNVFLVFLITFLLVLNMGGAFSAHMMMEGDMTPCPYMGMASLCTMTPLEHLSGWQNMFSVTLQESATLILLSFLILSLVWLFTHHLFKPPQSLSKAFSRYRQKEKVPSSLQLAFAQGLIHSKAY